MAFAISNMKDCLSMMFVPILKGGLEEDDVGEKQHREDD
jgi:hypothetical protein